MPSPLPDSQEYKKAKRLHLKATRNNKNQDPSWTPFRAAEKKYKSRFPPPDLSDVLDFAPLYPARAQEIERGIWVGRSDAVEIREMILPDNARKAYTIPSIPGIVILPGFLSSEQQRELIKWSLSEQARYPNETNLDAHYALPIDGIWNASRADSGKDVLIQPKVSDTGTLELEPPGPRRLIDNTPATPTNIFSIIATPKPPQAPSPTLRPSPPSILLPKLRWANIGWFYHWGTKQYDFTKGKEPVDGRVRQICRDAVELVDWQQVYTGARVVWGDNEPGWETWQENYVPDAGIVNFYQTKDTLMAHVDRSEICATSPLVSISLGNAAVFLIGGLTRDSEPVPILLRSGDVVIMSGPECRRSYHGVPRILENTLPEHLQSGASEWQPYADYMKSTRININVRQVFPKGFEPPIEIRTT